MIEFKLSEWFADTTQKVVTRTGQNVRIVCTDGPDETYPIVGFVEGCCQPLTWSNYGEYSIMEEHPHDIFFDKNDLTVFQRALIKVLHICKMSTLTSKRDIAIKYSPILLEIAKRELAVNTQDVQSKGGCTDYNIVKENITRKVIEKAVNWISLNAELYGGFNQGKLNEMVKHLEKELLSGMSANI